MGQGVDEIKGTFCACADPPRHPGPKTGSGAQTGPGDAPGTDTVRVCPGCSGVPSLGGSLMRHPGPGDLTHCPGIPGTGGRI